jgi:hypothetical protein
MIRIPKPSKQQTVFHVGETVYILGKHTVSASAPLYLITAQITHISHRQFVARELDANGMPSGGEWRFSNKHFGLSVFKSRSEAAFTHANITKNYNKGDNYHAV